MKKCTIGRYYTDTHSKFQWIRMKNEPVTEGRILPFRIIIFLSPKTHKNRIFSKKNWIWEKLKKVYNREVLDGHAQQISLNLNEKWARDRGEKKIVLLLMLLLLRIAFYIQFRHISNSHKIQTNSNFDTRFASTWQLYLDLFIKPIKTASLRA